MLTFFWRFPITYPFVREVLPDELTITLLELVVNFPVVNVSVPLIVKSEFSTASVALLIVKSLNAVKVVIVCVIVPLRTIEPPSAVKVPPVWFQSPASVIVLLEEFVTSKPPVMVIPPAPTVSVAFWAKSRDPVLID